MGSKEATELFELNFQLSKLPPSLNQMLRGHWRTRSAILKQFKTLAINEIKTQKAPAQPLVKYQIAFIRHTIRPLDFDNLAASFKPIMDALTVTNVIKDDKWGMTKNVVYDQVKAKTKIEQKITVSVKEMV